MADSKLVNLTGADSGDLINPSSVFFLAILPDETPVAIPGSELQKRVSTKLGVYLWTQTDQKVRNDGADQILTVDSPFYDPEGWWNASSPNILTCPNDSIKWAQANVHTYFNAGNGGYRRSELRYTDTTSTKYTLAGPLLGASSLYDLPGTHTEYRPQGTQWAPFQLHTTPFYCESGDQFVIVGKSTGSTTPTLLEFWWSINPVKLRT